MNGNSETGSKRFTAADYFKITILGFGISAFWGSFHIVLPVRLLDLVPEAQKNTYLGYLTFAGLLIAMVSQPIIGSLSDRSRFSWGRRRPFILAGALLAALFLPGIGLWESIALIGVTYCLLQIASNIAQAPYQGFIPDLVSANRRGAASGIKTMVELLGGFVMVRAVAVFMDRYSQNDTIWLWVALGTMAVFFLLPMVITVITVKEKPGTGNSSETTIPSLIKSFSIDLRQNRGFLWFLLSRGLMAIPGLALQTFALYYLKDVFQVANPAGATGNLMMVVGVSLIITALLAGRLSDKFGRKPILISAGFVGALGILLFFLSRSQMHLMLSGVVLGIANGAFWSTSWAQAVDMLPAGESARYMGIVNLASAAGSGLARLIGPLIDYFNTVGPNLGYSVMLLIITACFIAGALLLLKVKEVRRTP